MKGQRDIQTGDELLQEVKAGFVRQGTTFTAYCRAHHINPSNARIALRGAWNGPKARALIKKIAAAAGLPEAA